MVDQPTPAPEKVQIENSSVETQKPEISQVVPDEVNVAVEQPSATVAQVMPTPVPTTPPVDDPLADPAVQIDMTGKNDAEWVEKAKDVIKEFEDKPYQEEKEAEKLQEGYLKDRFGVQVDDPGDK